MVSRPSRRDGRIWEALPESWDDSRGLQRGPVGVGWVGRGQDSIPVDWEVSGGPSKEMRGVRVPPAGVGRVERPALGAEGVFWVIPEGHEGLGLMEEVKSPTRRAGKGQEFLLMCRQGLCGPPGGLGGVGRPSLRFRRGWEAVPKGQGESGGTSREAGGVGKVWRGWEACLDGW